MNFFPLDNPVAIFSLLLLIILATPYIFKKIKIPSIIGLIIAGSLIGPYGLKLMLRDASIELYGTVGLLYLMFIAGLEIDIPDFKKNSNKSIIFGLYTFSIPLIFGYLSSRYILKLPPLTTILVASIYSSHTLLTYPIIARFGVTKNRAVNIALGGTIIANTIALMILVGIVGMSEGDITIQFWIDLVIKFAAFGFLVLFALPILARKFLINEKDNIAQYLFVLGVVFLAGFLAEVLGIEAILGAFLAGLALNHLVPATSALKNRIEFIGNVLFIPIFLIGIGMLVNFRVFFTDLKTIYAGVIMTAVAISSKYIAAFLAQKSFKYNINEQLIIFGLTSSSAAATLAVIFIGYERLQIIDDYMLNAAILMILITCTTASFATEKGASKIAVAEETIESAKEDEQQTERILIPISHPETFEELINLGLILKNKKNKDNLFAVNIINSQTNSPEHEKKSKELLDKATKLVSATDQSLNVILRYDINISHGIYNTVREKKISDIIIGIHQKTSLTDSFLGKLTDGLLADSVANIYIYHAVQPFNTMKNMVVVIPEKAEEELGFHDFVKKIWNMADNTGIKFVIYASEKVIDIFKIYVEAQFIEIELINFIDWSDFLIVSSKLDLNSGLMVFMSRIGAVSRNKSMDKITKYLNKYFNKNNYIIYYPVQKVS